MRQSGFVTLLALAAQLALAAPAKDPEWEAIQTCQFAIKLSAHDPGSLEFPDGITRAYRKLSKNGIYTVQVRIRARNGFNAVRVSTVECKVEAKTGKLQAIRELR